MSAYNNVGIFWDYENCAPSSNASGFHLIDRIRQISQQFGSVNLFKAYLQFPEKTSPRLYSLRSELQACGVSLTDCPHNNGKNAVDLMMIVDIMAFVKDNPAPATIILISGDRDFAYMLSTIRWRQYHIVLVSNTFMTHDSLSTQANVTFDWQNDVLKSRNDGDAPRPSFCRHRRDTSISNSGRRLGFGSIDCAELTLDPKGSPQSLTGLNNGLHRLSFSAPPTSNLNTPGGNVQPARLDISKSAVNEEDPTAISSVSSLSSESDDWILTGQSPTLEDKPPAVNEEEIQSSPIFLSAQSSPELVPSDFEGGIPSDPGYLLLLGEDSLAPTPLEGPSTGVEHPACCPQGDSNSAKHTCDCRICLRSISATESVHSDSATIEHAACCPKGDLELSKHTCDCRICLRSVSTTESVRSDSATELAPPATAAKAELPAVEPASIPPVTSPSPNQVKPDTMSSSLNVLAPTFAPRFAPAEPSAPHQPASIIKPDLKDLIVVLNEMRLKGILKARFSLVAPLLLERKPDVYQSAGVSQLKTYLQLAEDMGIVSLEPDKDGDGWVSLRRPWHDTGTTKSRPPSPQRAHLQRGSSDPIFTKSSPSSPFRDLVPVLNELRINDDPEPRFSTVAPRLLRKNPHVYESAGTTKFKDYIDAAVKAGVVTVRGVRNGDGWMTLCDKWCTELDQSPRSPPKPQAIQNPPPTVTTPQSAFQPLASVLEDLRTKGQGQCRVSTVFSHLVWSGRPQIYELAGVTNFKDYMNSAVAAGIITVDGGDSSNPDALVRLCNGEDQKVIAPSASHAAAAHMSVHPVSAFEDLTYALNELRWAEVTEPRFSEVEPLVLSINPQAYERVAVTTIGDYIQAAGKAGLVTVRFADGDDDGWVVLRQGEAGPVRSHITAAKTTSIPTSNGGSRTFPNGFQISSTFRDLVLVLQQLRSTTGEHEARFASVVPLLLKRQPNAYQSVGVTKFKEYIGLAVAGGIVTVRGVKNGDGWISLCDSRPGNTRVIRTSPPAQVASRISHSSDETIVIPRMSTPVIPPMYKDLVWVLRQLRSTGDPEPLFSSIAPVLLKNDVVKARTLGAIGAIKFKPYAESARDAGIVAIHGDRVGEERVSLLPAWQGGSFYPPEGL